MDHGIAARVEGDRKERGIGDGARRDVEGVAEDVDVRLRQTRNFNGYPYSSCFGIIFAT